MTLPTAITTLAPDGQLTPAQKRRLLLDICRRRIKPGMIQGYAPDTLDDIESLIYLGQMEMKVPPQSSDSEIPGS